MSEMQEAPPRLLELGGPAGDCLRQALTRSQLLQPLPRFAQLRELRLRRARRQRALALVGLSSLIAVLGVRELHENEPPPSIYAEVAAAKELRPIVTGSSPHEQGSTSGPPPRGTPAAPAIATPPLRRSPVSRAKNGGGSSPTAPLAAEATGGARSCAQLARSGSAPAALECYARLGAGNGMTAELALFEQARLEGKVLRRPKRALLILEDYRRRFPAGTLRAEVMLAQIDWLLGSGDSVRALQVVNEALGSGLLRERTTELERLRTTLAAAAAPRSLPEGASR
jgi:hypothetical protein